jgi:hypothetical protein
MLSIVISPAKPSSWKRSAMRSESGKTVELPAVMMFPLTLAGSTSGRRLVPVVFTGSSV